MKQKGHPKAAQKNNHTTKISIAEAIDKGVFRGKQAQGLRYLLAHCPIKRKPSEKNSPAISYLPSFIQGVENRLLNICGIRIEALPLHDGTGRKIYDFRHEKTEQEGEK